MLFHTRQEFGGLHQVEAENSKPVNKASYHQQRKGKGRVEVGDGKSLFYWLVEANRSPKIKPLLLWLNGGPGCSSVAGGLFQEVGPFRVQGDGVTLSTNPYAWTQEVNLLFMESPAGIGFSLLQNPQKRQGDNSTAEDAYKFLLNWLTRFPQYKFRDFYIAGESYAGHYIPQLSQILWRRRNALSVTFKGFLLGNPILDSFNDYLGQFDYWWSHGLISEPTNNLLRQNCPNDTFLHPGPQCDGAIKTAKQEFGAIDKYNIFLDPCKDDDLIDAGEMALFGGPEVCFMSNTKKYLNRLDVQKAIHADNLGRPHRWSPCSINIFNNWLDSPLSVLPIFKELIAANIRIWVFSGDADAEVPLTATRNSLRTLNIPVLKQWYSWADDYGKAGGWAQIYKGLTYVTIRGAGHQVSLTHPQQSLLLLKKFLKDEPMPSPAPKKPPPSP